MEVKITIRRVRRGHIVEDGFDDTEHVYEDGTELMRFIAKRFNLPEFEPPDYKQGRLDMFERVKELGGDTPLANSLVTVLEGEV